VLNEKVRFQGSFKLSSINRSIAYDFLLTFRLVLFARRLLKIEKKFLPNVYMGYPVDDCLSGVLSRSLGLEHRTRIGAVFSRLLVPPIVLYMHNLLFILSHSVANN